MEPKCKDLQCLQLFYNRNNNSVEREAFLSIASQFRTLFDCSVSREEPNFQCFYPFVYSQEEQFLSKVEIKIKIPEELKPRLLDDWQNIVFNKKLVKVPAQITAQEILDAYIKLKVPFKSLTPNKECARAAVMKGVKDYFNVMLGPQLLYTQEREQYSQVIQAYPNQPISSLYSGIHLLRLFVRLGRALAYTRLDEKSVQLMLTVLHDFLKFLHRKADTYLSLDFYVPAVKSD